MVLDAQAKIDRCHFKQTHDPFQHTMHIDDKGAFPP
jgi:hypothetical protein